MEIYRIETITPQVVEAVTRLLPKLSATAQIPDSMHIGRIISSANTHLLVAEMEGVIVGMLTLVLVDIPTGRKAWIEDVVTDEAYRGCGVGRALVSQAIQRAKEAGAVRVYLTSNPSRKAAHALYSKCGFEEYNTSVFRLNL